MPIQPNGMLVADERQQSEEIPDQVIAAINSLEQDTSTSTELGHVDDIIKDLMELDDDLLDSLAAQICVDFDLFKYTDSEVDALSNNGEINLLYNSNVAVEEPQVNQETPSDFITQLASSEPSQQTETKPAMRIEMMETIAQNNVSELDQKSEFTPEPQISQPLDYEANEASYQTATNRTRHEEKYYEELPGNSKAHNQNHNGGDCCEERNRMTGEELAVICVSQGVDENITQLSQMHNQRKLTTKITTRLDKPKEFLNSIKRGKREHKCKLCTATFRRKCDLASHLLTYTHKETEICGSRDKSFHKEYKSMIHTSSKAVKNNGKTKSKKSYECEHCKKTFLRKSVLVIHRKTHSAEKPFECVVCKKSFRWKQYLQAHFRVHSDERPFECVVCQKSFRWKVSLEFHSKVHLDVKPFECVVCKKSFRWKQYLRAHLRIHSGEMPFECVVCKKTFRWKPGFIVHSRIHSVRLRPNPVLLLDMQQYIWEQQ